LLWLVLAGSAGVDTSEASRRGGIRSFCRSSSAIQITDGETVHLHKDQCCGSWILIYTHRFLLIPDPGSQIPDPKRATKERGEKKLVVIRFCSHKFHKIENYFISEIQ
jgi:hypothetical protein